MTLPTANLLDLSMKKRSGKIKRASVKESDLINLSKTKDKRQKEKTRGGKGGNVNSNSDGKRKKKGGKMLRSLLVNLQSEE